MAICKHCGAEIEENLEYCPNCKQRNTEKESSSNSSFFDLDEEIKDGYNIFDDSDEIDALFSQELLKQKTKEKAPYSEEIEELPIESISDVLEDETFAENLESINLDSIIEENDVKETVAKENELEELNFSSLDEIQSLDGLDFVLPDGSSAEGMDFALSEMDLSTQNLMDSAPEKNGAEPKTEAVDITAGIDQDLVKELDFVELDGLFQDLEKEEHKEKEKAEVDQELGEMLAGSLEEDESKKKKKKKKKEKKEKQPFLKRIFGNVPVDPSKIKPEPTEEELAEAKAKKAEEKKQAAEAKKVAKQEKIEAAKLEKERKAQEQALAKEAKKAKKLEEAKQILEEVQETRINRVGATIVFVLFAVCAVGIAFGSDLFSYSVSIDSAEKSFQLALDNDVSYYNDAYEQIYGLDIKNEDQELNDKIMTVMFVNKELNSYNSHIILEDYESALHSLLKGMYRYGKYYETAIPLGIDRDLDFVRTQILKELEKTFHISEDEAEVLRNQLEQAMTSEEASKEYSLMIYEIVKECELAKE